MPALDPSVLSSIPPGVDPADYLAQLRKARIADFLTQDSLQAPAIQQPQAGVGGKYVEARISPLAGLAKLAEAVMGRKATDAANTLAASNYAKQLAAFGQPPQMAQAQSAATQAPSSQGGQPNVDGSAGGAPGAAPAVVAQPPAAGNSPLNPMALPASLAMRLYMQKPEEYAKLLAGPDAWQMALRANNGDRTRAMAYVLQTPEYRTKLAEYGGDANALAQATRDAATKAGTIAMRQGEDAMIPDGRGGYTERRNPVLAQGAVVDRDAQGNPIRTRLLPGEIGAVSARKLAEENATPREVPNAIGQPTFVSPNLHPGNATSGAGGATIAPGGATVAPPRQYFPTPPGGGLQTTAGKESQEAGAKNGQEYSQNLAKDAQGALNIHRGLAELSNLAANAPPSVANNAKAQVGQMMLAGGASPELVSKFLGVDTDALQAANKQNASLAVSSIHAMTSRGTNFDLDTFMRNNPNLMMTPGGFSRVVEYMDKMAQDTMDKQADFQKFKKEIPPDDWEAEHTAHWNELMRKKIDAGKTNSRKPLESFVR